MCCDLCRSTATPHRLQQFLIPLRVCCFVVLAIRHRDAGAVCALVACCCCWCCLLVERAARADCWQSVCSLHCSLTHPHLQLAAASSLTQLGLLLSDVCVSSSASRQSTTLNRLLNVTTHSITHCLIHSSVHPSTHSLSPASLTFCRCFFRRMPNLTDTSRDNRTVSPQRRYLSCHPLRRPPVPLLLRLIRFRLLAIIRCRPMECQSVLTSLRRIRTLF